MEKNSIPACIVALALGFGCEDTLSDEGDLSNEAGEAIVSGRDLSCGQGTRRIFEAEGAFHTPESCTWHPSLENGGGLPPGRFLCSVTAYASGNAISTHDGVGWIAQFTRDGQAYHPVGGLETGSFSTDPGWATQCGAAILGSPLGLAVNPSAPDVDPTTPDDGKLYVVEGGHVDADNNPATQETQAIAVFTMLNGACFFEHWIPLPTVTANDVAFSGGAIYMTDSNFSSPTQGAIYKVTLPDVPGSLPSPWKSGVTTPNPIVAHVFKGPSDAAAVPYLFVATLGTQLDPAAPGHNGKLLRIRISDRQVTEYAGIAGEYDGLAWAPGIPSPSLILSDLSTRSLVRVNPTTGVVSPFVDLSSYVRQTAGITTDGAIPATVAVTDFRGDVLLVR